MDDDALAAWAARWQIPPAAMFELSRLYDPSPTAGDGGEARVQSECRLAAPRLGCSLWRNNSGAAVDETGRVVRYGLENVSKRLNDVFKSSDLIGVTRGRFTAVECKPPGWNGPRNAHEQAQANFIRTVETMGGIGMFVTDVNQYIERVRGLS